MTPVEGLSPQEPQGANAWTYNVNETYVQQPERRQVEHSNVMYSRDECPPECQL